MPDTPTIPLHKPSTVTGESYHRVMSVHIDNPYNGLPSLVLVEEQLTILPNEVIHKQVGSLTTDFDPTNMTHLTLSNALNSEYERLRDIRDNPPVGPPAEPLP